MLAEFTERGDLIGAMKIGTSTVAEAKQELRSLIGVCVAKLLRDPLRYDPAKGKLAAYIWRDIQGDALNEAAKRKRIGKHERLGTDDQEGRTDKAVEVAAGRGNPQPTPEEAIIDAEIELTDEQAERARRFMGSLEPAERDCLDLMTSGVREHWPYAEVLGVTHLDVDKQRKAVNRLKDRLKKKMERLR